MGPTATKAVVSFWAREYHTNAPFHPPKNTYYRGGNTNTTHICFHFVLEPRVGFERLFPSDIKLAKESRYKEGESYDTPRDLTPNAILPHHPWVRSCAANESGSAGATGAIQFIRV